MRKPADMIEPVTVPPGVPRPAVLIVDDRPANLIALEAILEPLKVDLVRANSGEDALRALLMQEFALILLDVQMPGLDGFRVASIIRERKRTRYVPIIFLTALSREAQHIFRGYEEGAVDYLVKPFDPHILRTKVRVFIDLWLKTALVEQKERQLREKELEAQARESERRYRTLVDSMPVAVCVADARGDIHYANLVAREFSGQESNGGSVSLLDTVHPEDREAVRAAWYVTVTTGAPFNLQFRLQRRIDGQWRWHHGRATAERGPDGRVTAWILSAADIDEEKRINAALQQTERELRLASEAKDQFLAAASHELRTPLAAAKGHAHLAIKKLGEDTGQFPGKAFATILRQVDRMAKLVDDLLDVTRLQAGRLSLDVEEFDFSELLREACERMQVLSSKHPIALRVPDSCAMVADRGRLDQVITNLLSNAIRYSPNGGTVEVTVVEDGDEVQVTVRDHGVGIPKEKQGVIFERFGRAHGSRFGGLGLGLTISHGIVVQHAGRISVESSGIEGEGTTFVVRLPKQLPPSARHTPVPIAAAH